MASSSLQPLKDSNLKIFIKTQFRTKPRPPPLEPTSLAGKTALVTGSNVGLGLESSRQLLSYGLSRLIIGVRSLPKGEAAAAGLRKQFPNAQVDVWELNMSSYQSIQAFISRCEAELPNGLDMAILSAAVANPAWKTTSPKDGKVHEEMFQVNYLSTALLAILLLPVLRAREGKGPGRLTIVTSNLAITSQFTNRNANPFIPSFDEPPKNGWGAQEGMDRYSTTKTLTLMLTQKLGELVSPDQVVVNTVDPGTVAGTAMSNRFPAWVKVVHSVIQLAARTVEEGAWTYLDAVAVKGKESHGGLCMNWDIYPFHPFMYTDEGKATTERLWEETIAELAEVAPVGQILAGMK
ncbi:hypothetical protein QBC46DRAFT_298100 [Diplogelasinospora grovesii]|uniref:Short-chain dehydrogenase/reductase family protein n=1 Tax=Diplogelasinospora grovesii TaxID=303347 RepID=A0AAN6MZ65_9PEZI|nr:hypothetical protein QBC46DRAFT_298100 [Diplogelasinospora grovesii]